MRTAVLLALWDDDSTLLRQIDAERDLYVSRRCADISELLADVAVGLGQLAIIDEQLDGQGATQAPRSCQRTPSLRVNTIAGTP